jgi:RNA polymerase sigma-70 factor (ECF subfamily)
MIDLPKDKTHALLERWAKGDDAALSELFPAYFEKVVSLIALDGLPPEDIEDAVQSAFVKLHLWLKKGNAHPERLTGFLLVSARRFMRERAEKGELPKADPYEAARAQDDLASTTRSLASSLGSREFRGKLREAVERLDGRIREIYLLRLEGLSNQEIGIRLGMARYTVGRYVYDGLELLRQDFERMAREEAKELKGTALRTLTSADVMQALERIPWVYADPVRCRHLEKLDDRWGAKKLRITPAIYIARLNQGYQLLETELGADFPKSFDSLKASASP